MLSEEVRQKTVGSSLQAITCSRAKYLGACSRELLIIWNNEAITEELVTFTLEQ